MDWNDLKIFCTVAKTTSLSEAARSLGVNQSTVSRRLSTLEQSLGAELVIRGGRQTELTQAGTELFRRSDSLAEEFKSIELDMSGVDARLSGVLRIASVDVFAARYLAPHIANFMRVHDEIDVILETANRSVDLTKRQADVAIRITNAPNEVLIGRRMFDFAMAVYCEKDCKLPVDQVNWIGFTRDHPVNQMIAKYFPNEKITHRTDSFFVMNELVSNGAGKAIFPRYWADKMSDIRRLSTLPNGDTGLGLWVLTHPKTRKAARVRVFVDYMYEVLIKDRDLFEGTL